MTPDWSELFATRSLPGRAMQLSLPGLAGPVWFAGAHAADLKGLPPEMFLTSAENTRASAFKFGQPRENFTLGRLAGKLALFAGSSRREEALIEQRETEPPHAGCYLREFEIGNGERGEPVVCAGDLQSPRLAPTGAADGGCKPPALAVSLSHVNGLGAAAAFPAGARVGLDLELIDANRAETVRKGVPLSAEEENWLKTSSLPEATALLLLWTARESLGKALGCGLACKWETLALREIRPTDAARFNGSFLHHPSFQCASWVGPDAVLSLAFERSDRDTAGVTSPP